MRLRSSPGCWRRSWPAGGRSTPRCRACFGVAGTRGGWREKSPGVPVTGEATRSGAAKRLVEVSRTEQLLVVGRHGHPHGPVGRLGSVSQAVVHHAHCPVAVLPAP